MATFYENKDVSILCPECKSLLTKADKRDTSKHKLQCKRCRKLILYIPSNGYTEVVDMPTRNVASGVRFY